MIFMVCHAARLFQSSCSKEVTAAIIAAAVTIIIAIIIAIVILTICSIRTAIVITGIIPAITVIIKAVLTDRIRIAMVGLVIHGPVFIKVNAVNAEFVRKVRSI